MVIVDRGSSVDLGKYSPRGHNCVAQSLYASIFYNEHLVPLKTKKRIAALSDSAQKAGTLKSLTGIDLSKILRVAHTNEGIGQSSIRRLTPMTGKIKGNIQVWTPETPDG